MDDPYSKMTFQRYNKSITVFSPLDIIYERSHITYICYQMLSYQSVVAFRSNFSKLILVIYNEIVKDICWSLNIIQASVLKFESELPSFTLGERIR